MQICTIQYATLSDKLPSRALDSSTKVWYTIYSVGNGLEQTRKVTGGNEMPVKVTPEELADKWARRLKGSIEDMRRGVDRVQDAPGAKAAAAADKWQARISEDRTKRKWAARVGAVSLEDWKRSMTEKGLSRIASGVDGAAGKMVRFAGQLVEHQNRGLQQINRMPDLTLEDSINRMAAWARHMANFEVS